MASGTRIIGLLAVVLALGVLSTLWAVIGSWLELGGVEPAWAESGQGEGKGGALIGLLGKFHPPTVHFPVALILMAGLAELLFMRFNNLSFDFTARFMLFAACAFSVPSIGFGFAAAAGELYESELRFAFDAHRILGIATGVLVVLTAGLAQRATMTRHGRGLYRALLIVTMLCVAAAAAYGGKLVYGPD